MNNKEILEQIKGGLIVSCQALKTEPLYSSDIMARMAVAAEGEGAVGIRANTICDILEIRKRVKLPMIGIIKEVYDDSDVYITPTEKEIEALIETGVEIIAIDGTKRLHTGGRTLKEIFTPIRKKYPNQLFMADCSNFEDAKSACELGFDLVGTTLAGYTKDTAGRSLPDVELIERIAKELPVPVVAEGGIHYPCQLKEVFEKGAFTAVVGGAITRPQEICRRFVAAIK
ncbi:MAG: N-acetylmannosamine-6-phosphate 2-epimerase [Clostridia bacterium]